jgi:hypothetical protein
MSTDLEKLREPIVAIAYEDRETNIHFLYCEEPIFIGDLDFQDSHLRIGDFSLVLKNMNAIFVCTEETLKELKEKLQNT